MKKLILGSVILLKTFLFVSGQDKIITQKNDTVDCKIIKIIDDKIYFEIDSKGIKTTGSILKSEVNSLQMSTETMQMIIDPNRSSKSTNNRIAVEPKKERTISQSPKKKKDPFLINLNSGYGYLLGNTKAARDNLVNYGLEQTAANNYFAKYHNVLISDFSVLYNCIDLDRSTFSLGLTYVNTYNGSEVAGIYDIQDGIHLQYGTYSEDIFTNLYALSLRFTFYTSQNKNSIIYFEGGNGLLTYRNKLKYGYSPMLITAITSGSFSRFGYGFRITSSLWIDINAGLFTAINKKYKIENKYSEQEITLSKSQYESLSKATLSIGLSYKF